MIKQVLNTPAAIAAGSVAVVLGVGGALTQLGPWYERLHKPSWQPPGWLFGPAWTTIGILAGCSGVSAWNAARGHGGERTVIGLFAANAGLNTLWTVLFFTAKRPDWALIEVVPLWGSIAALMFGLGPHSRKAAWLLLPYLAWVSFAAYLNLTIVRLNAPFGESAARS